MMTFIRCAVLALMLSPTVSLAQDLSAGLHAWADGDYATAVREWRPLAEQGNEFAQNNLATLHLEGWGVVQDYAEAARLYRLAAEQGNASAQNNLGGMYRSNGQGVVQDIVTAHMWFNIAAANGSEGAAKNRDTAENLMNADAIAEAQRRARTCMESDYQDCE